MKADLKGFHIKCAHCRKEFDGLSSLERLSSFVSMRGSDLQCPRCRSPYFRNGIFGQKSIPKLLVFPAAFVFSNT
jgi:DNA-directed RNA polymerase subunit RPC12/RpoP